MTQKEWAAYFEEKIPASLSCEWDHDGVQCLPEPDHEVKTVLTTLDVTERTVDYAIKNGVDLIISHHPLLFRPLYSLSDDSESGRILTLLMRYGIALLSYHTRADKIEGGVADLLASRLGLCDVQSIDTEEGPLVRVGTLPSYTRLGDYAESVREALSADGILLATDDENRPVRRVAVSGGEGGDFVSAARRAGADLFVSGRIGYHRMLEAASGGMAMIEAGHYFTEREVVYFFAKLAEERDPDAKIVLYAPKLLSLLASPS